MGPRALTGKSSISLRLVRCKWTHEYDPTIQDFYSVTRVVDGKTYQLNLTDTAGQEEYDLSLSLSHTRQYLQHRSQDSC